MAPDRNKPFPRLVRRWRRAHELTRAEACRRLTIPYRTLEDWEAGRRTPRGIALKLIIARLSR